MSTRAGKFVTYRRSWPGWEWFTWQEGAEPGETPLLLAVGFVLRRRNVMRAARTAQGEG